MTAATGVREVDLPGWGLRARVRTAGEGPPLLWLHGLQAPGPGDPLLEALAAHFQVMAPIHPGFDDLDDLARLRDVHELALYHDDLCAALGLGSIVVGGHSFGGMVAAELAAHVPARVERLVLAAPMGLWRDDEPSTDPFPYYSSAQLPELLWADRDSTAARSSTEAFAALGADPVEGAALASGEEEISASTRMMIAMVQGMTAVGKFTWPLPDKGLARRLHRIAAPTLVVWGAKDALSPPSYAEDLEARIPSVRRAVLDEAGHMAPYEHLDEFVALVTDFVAR